MPRRLHFLGLAVALLALVRGARGVAHWVVRAGRRAWRGVGESGEYWPLEGYYLRLPGVLDIRIA